MAGQQGQGMRGWTGYNTPERQQVKADNKQMPDTTQMHGRAGGMWKVAMVQCAPGGQQGQKNHEVVGRVLPANTRMRPPAKAEEVAAVLDIFPALGAEAVWVEHVRIAEALQGAQSMRHCSCHMTFARGTLLLLLLISSPLMATFVYAAS